MISELLSADFPHSLPFSFPAFLRFSSGFPPSFLLSHNENGSALVFLVFLTRLLLLEFEFSF